MRKVYVSLLLILLSGLLVGVAQAELFVVVNVDNSAKTMSPEQIERLFLLKSKRFENGDAAEPVNQTESAAVREKFNSKVLGRDEAQLKYYWSRKMFSGGDRPPPIVGGDADVEEFVAEHPGGIGYMAVAPKDARVKVVLKLPD